MTALGAVAALPVSFLVVWLLLHSRVSGGLERTPDASRWRAAATPLVGGVGIYAGFTVGLWLCVLGPLGADRRLLGIFAGASLLFLAGLIDDVRTLPPVAKLAAQLGGAAIVLSTGTTVQLVHNKWIAIPLGVIWLVGMTNAFNLLDNMDGLAGSLAVIAAVFFASSAAILGGADLVLVLSVSLALAVLGFLPFNLRPGRPALAWMGDSGSQLIGFTLASLGLASSYTVASSTVATLVLPVLVLAVPILDTTLVTIVRLLEGRPVSQGGRDHSSHRLVSLGVSETGAVVLLALVSASLGATSLAYEAFGNGRVAAIGVLVSFALLVQLGSFLADVDRTRGKGRYFVYIRRTTEVVVDGALIAASFLLAYLLRFDGIGTPNQRRFFLLSLPVLLLCRYIALLLLGMYAGVWRYTSVRDAVRIGGAVAFRESRRWASSSSRSGPIGDFSPHLFVIDALICSVAITAARFAERAICTPSSLRSPQGGPSRTDRRRGPCRAEASFANCARHPTSASSASSTTTRACVAAELNGVKRFRRPPGRSTPPSTVRGPTSSSITIPSAAADRLDEIIGACEAREIDCRVVRREIDVDPRVILEPRTR